MQRSLVIMLAVVASTFLCCGACEIAADEIGILIMSGPVEIVGGYSMGKPLGGRLEVWAPPVEHEDGVSYSVVVGSEVVSIGWNEDFILAERHYLGEWIGATPDSSKPKWYIIEVSSGKVHGDLSGERFQSLIEELSVQDSIEMLNAEEVFAELRKKRKE